MSWNPDPPSTSPPDYDTDLPIYQNVGDFVSWGYQYINYLGAQAFNTASTALNALAAMDFPEPPVVEFPEFPVLDVDFTIPEDPALPSIDTTLEDVPDAPVLSTPTVDDLPEAPTFDAEAPVINLPAAPDLFDGEAPEAPDVDFEVTLPDAPDIDIPEFTAIPPLAPIDAPDVTFSYTEDAYTRTIDVKSVVMDMLAGNTGLPTAVEQALFARARSREDVTAQKAVEEAMEDWSSRGFSLPGGEIAKRVEAVRQRNQDAANTISRDILIKSWDIRIESLRQAVQQGLAYEAQLIDLHNQAAGRKLQVAELTVRMALEVYNAHVAYFNAQIAAFNAQAEVYRLKIQQSGQKIEIYKGLVTGVQAQVDVKRAQMEGFKAEIEGYTARVDANKSQFQAYGELVKAEGVKGDIYKAVADAFASRVRAYGSNVDAVLATVKAQTDIEGLKVQGYQGTLAAVRERLAAKSQQVQAQGTLFDAQSRVFTAKTGAIGEKARSTIAAYSAQVETARSQSQIAIANANMVSENAGRNATLAMEAQRGIAQVSGQVTAGALSAVNVHTQLSSSGNYSASAGTSVSYAVDGGEAAPPTLPY